MKLNKGYTFYRWFNKIYNIESRYNLIFYINVVIDLYEDTSLSKKRVGKADFKN